MDLAPLYGLRLRTDRLELRWPDEEEILELGRLAETGVHDPAQMPFLVPWTDGIGRPGFLDGYRDYHRGLRERWHPDDWTLDLAVWAGEDLVGTQGLTGRRFAQTHLVESGSWIARRFQGEGYGTEMRAAVLELAFHGLGAETAVSPVLDGNVASARVSEKLGYVEVESDALWVTVRGERRRERRLQLTRDRWIDRERISVRISGLEPCLPLFGLNHPPDPRVPFC